MAQDAQPVNRADTKALQKRAKTTLHFPTMSRTETIDPSIFSSDRPLYQAVRDQIIKGLVSGEWKAQEALPSEARLAERFGVSIPTVRAAIAELAAAKVLMRKQGKGTYVSSHNHHNVYQFFHMVPDFGPKALPRFALLSFAKSTAPADIAQALQLAPTKSMARVFEFSIVLGINDIPVMLSEITVSGTHFPGLSEKIIRQGGDTVYGIYQAKFGVTVTRTVDQLRAVLAKPFVVRQLELKRDEPVLEIRRVGYTFNDVPVEVRVSYARTDRYYFLLRQGHAG
ncbi:MAG: UTRA domain-containing protein [Betaproteobacteria bacterium]|nr:UTRA domain-containing protein [Betaproteobacteria bacterium]